LLSLRPAGAPATLRGVVIDARGAADISAASSTAALAGALQTGPAGTTQPGNAAFMGLLGAMAAGMRSGAGSRPAPELLSMLRLGGGVPPEAAQRGTAASMPAPSEAAAAARLGALEAAVGSAKALVSAATAAAGPAGEDEARAVLHVAETASSPTLAALTQRMSRLEARVERAVADFDARLQLLEQARTPRDDGAAAIT
jgi:hypothetical protein